MLGSRKRKDQILPNEDDKGRVIVVEGRTSPFSSNDDSTKILAFKDAFAEYKALYMKVLSAFILFTTEFCISFTSLRHLCQLPVFSLCLG